jgi:uncharacterized protein YifE (UPF0438 family)
VTSLVMLCATGSRIESRQVEHDWSKYLERLMARQLVHSIIAQHIPRM